MQTREATEQDVKDFNGFKKLHVPVEKAMRLVTTKELVYQASDFHDAGADFTQLVTKTGEAIGFWPGF